MEAKLQNEKPAFMTCKKQITIDTELHIRHGSPFPLRGVLWQVTDQTVRKPLLGRPVL